MTRTARVVRALHPGGFAYVMATGIVSIGLYDPAPAAQSILSGILAWLAILGYLALVALQAWRVLAYRREVRADLRDASRSFGFLTFVAASGVLGSRLALDGHVAVATALLVVAALAWLVFGYLVPWSIVVGGDRKPLVARADGTWFLIVVASQAVAVLITELAPAAMVAGARPGLGLLAVLCWSVGLVGYLGVGLIVVLRLVLHPFGPEDLTPPYWIAMGATAITVLAGSRIANLPDAPATVAAHGLAAGISLLCWGFGTWLILPLVGVGWWRHVRHRVPLRYDTSWWSIVFPLGMYAVASRTLGSVDRLPYVGALGRVAIWVALAAWLVAAIAMLRAGVAWIVRRRRTGEEGTRR